MFTSNNIYSIEPFHLISNTPLKWMKSVKFITPKKIKIKCQHKFTPLTLQKNLFIKGGVDIKWMAPSVDWCCIYSNLSITCKDFNQQWWWVKEIIFKKWLFIWKSGEFSIGSNCYICPVTETFTSNKLSGYIYLIENIGSFTYGWVVHGARNFLTEGVNVPQWGGLCKFFHG